MIFRFLPIFVALFFYLAPFHAKADDTPFAIVDVQAILEKSKAAMSVQSQVKSHREKLQKEVSKHEDELRKKEKELLEKRSSMTQEEFAKQGQEFEKELMETRKLVQKRKNGLEDALSESLGKLRDEIAGIVEDISEERGYQIVFSERRIIFASDDTDITKEVTDRLNKQLSKIDLKIKG